MKKFGVEFFVGIFVLMGTAALAYLAVDIAGVSGDADKRYSLVARFDNSSGLKEGAFIEVAGVRVGQVQTIALDYDSFESVVTMVIDKEVSLPEDSIASIRTAGIIGDRFIKLSPGGAEEVLAPGDEIFETESSISIEELVSKYIFEE
ncbi:outer membrane lipid asymmetry maintenance protein MlaD [Exilibacterium tricleocarpae]|uniref:Outer membrane lipid asymmetry maintenance protein MlaD n=1 Tax=Exilibacterium tricleocarpae TaxID=2591008 RepID=A0A545U9E6_9GAMM|nr:outer membrane lipid asymmetry maintenance protein MlaD [Exilibacterium tricleocarpae]TQV86096.1 outer membrane lipid asymmetry maintenance protein MlaD [Exilibacterium tricleocarpae]